MFALLRKFHLFSLVFSSPRALFPGCLQMSTDVYNIYKADYRDMDDCLSHPRVHCAYEQHQKYQTELCGGLPLHINIVTFVVDKDGPDPRAPLGPSHLAFRLGSTLEIPPNTSSL